MSAFDLQPEINERTAFAAENGVLPQQIEPTFWQSAWKPVALAVPRVAAKATEFAGLALATPAVIQDEFNDTHTADFFFQGVDYPRRVADYLTPDPKTVGTAGHILGGVTEGLLELGLGGGNPAVLASMQGLEGAENTLKQGGSVPAALGVGGVNAATAALGVKVAPFGPNLLSKIITGAGGNVALGSVSRGANQAILTADGQPALASQYQPFGKVDMATDFVLGGAFGGVHHWLSPVTPTQLDAAMTLKNATHFQEGSAPGVPLDIEASVKHQEALETALQQLDDGQPVDVSETGVQHANFAPRELPEAHDVPAEFAPKVVPTHVTESPTVDEHVAKLPPEQQRVMTDVYARASEAKPGFDETTRAIAKDVGGEAMLAPLKGTARAVEKTLADYGGNAAKLKDVVRSTIVAPDLHAAQRAVESINQRLSGLHSERNTLSPDVKPSSFDGYRDIKVNVKLENGTTAEMQVNVPEMLAAKDKAHPLYEKVQKIERQAALENRDLVPHEQKLIADLLAKQRKIYSAAWDEALTKARKSSSEIKVPLWEKDETGNLRGSGPSQARQTYSAVSDAGTPSTSANTVPGGKESGNIESPPDASIAESDTPELKAANALVMENPTAKVSIDVDSEGNPVKTTAAAAFKQIQLEHEQAVRDAGAFEAAVTCFIGRG